jgi:hypothetical protein
MPSNRELAAKAVELGEALGRDVRTTGLNHSALEALVEELQSEVDARAAESPQSNDDALADTMPATPSAKHAAEEPETVAELPAAAPEAPAATMEAPSAPVYAIAPGHSLKCLRGRMTPGMAVSARDFVHGQPALDHLVSVGAVLKS